MSLELWEKVCKTDPDYTKAFSRAGGFSGTAINATYLIRKATELWGPLGGKWGFKIEDSSFVPGANGDVIHVLQIWFRHPEGDFQTFGQTTFVGKNKNGSFTDEEAPKKSLTDALTKALSMLGFSADVHLGLFDDNKYVNDRRREEAEKNRVEKPALPKKPSQTTAEWIKANSNSSNAVTTVEIPHEKKEQLDDLLEKVLYWLSSGSADDAWLELDNAALDPDAKTYLWNFFTSSQRSAIKKAGDTLRKETA